MSENEDGMNDEEAAERGRTLIYKVAGLIAEWETYSELRWAIGFLQGLIVMTFATQTFGWFGNTACVIMFIGLFFVAVQPLTSTLLIEVVDGDSDD